MRASTTMTQASLSIGSGLISGLTASLIPQPKGRDASHYHSAPFLKAASTKTKKPIPMVTTMVATGANPCEEARKVTGPNTFSMTDGYTQMRSARAINVRSVVSRVMQIAPPH